MTSAAWLLLVSGAIAAEPGRPATPDEAAFFERRVRPILVEHCASCHGPLKAKGGLRLDSAEGLRHGADSGPVIDPGAPERSPSFVLAVRHNLKIKMPPREPLTPKEVADLEAWVKMGAPWPTTVTSETKPEAKRHWAFQPVGRPVPPAVKRQDWVRNDVDRFILARLEGRDLTPSPTADRTTLLRRVTFDLTGLPPTPEEVDAFLKDDRPDAYEQAVDRLLGTPAYGERWARHWLDVARYADTKGYVFFEETRYPWAWTYRDYVIRAFNDDLPYDRFILEQLAADRLTLGADKRALTALGFLTIGGRFMNNPHDILDDRIDVVTRGLMGLTVTCARCHDHKFDPIPQKDYYALYGVFASSVEPAVLPLFAEPPLTPEYAAFEKELAVREGKLADFLEGKRRELVTSARKRSGEYLLAAHALRDKPRTDDFMLLADGNDLNPALTARWQAFLSRTRRTHHPVFAPWHELAALPEAEFAAQARDIVARLAAAKDPARPLNRLVVEALAAQPPATLADAAKLYGDLLQNVDAAWQEEVRRRTAENRTGPTRLDDPAREELRRVLYGPDAPADVTPGLFSELELLPDRPSQGKLQEFRKAVEQWRATGPAAPPRANVLNDTAVPYEPRVFLRGNPNTPGEAVPRRFLEVLSGPERKPFGDGSGRLELARAIASPDNPLTARVLVNRVWMHHFGAGLVRTPGDFGTRGEPPTHPELLDFLADRFVKDGWSVKKLHRLIVLSATYRQASVDRPDSRRADPENLLLWRMNRSRLDFESTRDALLAVAGRLDRSVGGPSVGDALAPGGKRRTLYASLDRLNVPPLWRAFDFPGPDATAPQRDVTTTPPQALFLLNHPLVHDCARSVVRRPDVSGKAEVRDRVDRLHRVLYGRPATGGDVEAATAFLGAKPDEEVWKRYVHALMLANEFTFVD